MHKKYIFLSLLLVFGLLLASCTSTSNNPVTPAATTGNVFVSSVPVGAQIWYENGSGVINSGKVTPDTILNLSLGNHTIILKLTGYFDDTSVVNIVAGTQSLGKILSSDKSVTNFGPIQVWETVGTSADQPSGIILKTGRAASVSTVGVKDSVDIYYDGNAFVLATAFNINARSTKFYLGGAASLTDGVASPLQTANGWVTQVGDTPGNYFFLYDQDHHYSKMVILSRNGGTPGNPSVVSVQWLYNNKVDDIRF
jgi:hypothetical protein